MYKIKYRNRKFFLLSLFFAFLFNSGFIHCQNDDSNLILGGNFSLSQNKNQRDNFLSITGGVFRDEERINRTFSFNLAPYIGKAINRSSYVGVQLSYTHSIIKSDEIIFIQQNFTRIARSSIGVELFYRKLFLPKNKLHFYLQPNIGYSYLFGKEESNAPALIENKGNLFLIASDIGGIYRLGEKWNLLLEISALGYSNRKTRSADMPESITINRFRFNPNLNNIRLGVERKF